MCAYNIFTQIVDVSEIANKVSRIKCLKSGIHGLWIQNPRLPWITLHGARHSSLYQPVIFQNAEVIKFAATQAN